MNMETPILIIVFNRPDKFKSLISALRSLKPKNLYISGDGPRSYVESDLENISEVRRCVELIDWQCSIKTNWQDENLGCGRGPEAAISWFFKHVPEGIILEDDCIPNKSFYHFQTAMLEKYRDHKDIYHISGCNFQDNIKRGKASYYFSRLPIAWGWSTWSDRWNKFDYDMKGLDQFIFDDEIRRITPSKRQQQYHISTFIKTLTNEIQDVWDYRWKYTIFKNNGLCITPNYNLVQNIGVGQDSTHTYGNEMGRLLKPTEDINQIIDPKSIRVCRHADDYHMLTSSIFPRNLKERIYRKIRFLIITK